MSFTLIAGTFHVVGKGRTGKPTGFQPDGDSIQFKPDNPRLLDGLQRNGSAYRLTSIGSTQLRFEGIDALELHFGGSHQPRPLADEARDYLTGQLGMNPVPYAPPENLTAKPPVPGDGAAGFILSRALEAHGRPVSFAYAGAGPAADGSQVNLTAPVLRKSLNFKTLAAGNAYPLYYDTLFADLRAVFTAAAAKARASHKGIWANDASQSGLTVTDQAGLEADGVVFPKLFRRLTEYLSNDTAGGNLAGFSHWLESKRERVLDTTTGGFTHLDNVIGVTGNTVRLLRLPEELVFVSATTSSRTVAPWLAV